jgi:hypothetical protein
MFILKLFFKICQHQSDHFFEMLENLSMFGGVCFSLLSQLFTGSGGICIYNIRSKIEVVEAYYKSEGERKQ